MGETIINQHIDDLNLRNLSADNTALKLMGWQKANVADAVNYEEKNNTVLKIWMNKLLHLYRINEEYRLFYKTSKASWIILSRTGRCGENVYYFVELMSKLGFKARKVCKVAEDHCWTEYFDGERRVIAATSDNQIFPNLKDYGSGMTVSKLEAEEVNGSTEDVSSDYFLVKKLNVEVNGSPFMTAGSEVVIFSTVLMNSSPDNYKSPIEVERKAYQSGNVTFDLGVHEYYLIEWQKNMILFTVYEDRPIDFTKVNRTKIQIEASKLSYKNLKLTPLNIFVIGGLLLIAELIIMHLVINHNKQYKKSEL